MTTTTTVLSTSAGGPIAWERQLQPVLETIAAPVPRAVLIGNAGSGKSTGLRHLRDALARRGRETTLLRGPEADVSRISRSHVLMVDDLHLWDDALLAPLRERAEDPDAALIVARRPWPATAASRDIVRMLEGHSPVVVLGHVLRSDLLDHLGDERAMSDGCVEHVLEMTGGVAWLVDETLRRHDERDCAGGRGHDELDRSLAEAIAHRLDTVDRELRERIEEICVAPVGAALPADSPDEWLKRGHAEGLLQRNGLPVPLVRRAVRASIPARRLLEASLRSAGGLQAQAAEESALLTGLQDERISVALTTFADDLLRSDPLRAADLYRRAIDCGAPAAELMPRRARAAWSSGDFQTAAALAEDALREHPLDDSIADARRDGLSDITAAVWASRAMMQRAHDVHRLVLPTDAARIADATIASFGVGSVDPPDAAAPGATLPSAHSVSMEMLRAGLRASIAPDGGASALADLVRAAETYTAAHAVDPICELPAVIAAVTALNLGALPTARSVIDDAINGDHGGPWARPRLQLWRAWISVQQARAHDARESLRLASAALPLCARDDLLAHAVRVALARRYDDAVGLEASWSDARGVLLRAEVDLFLLHPFAEFFSAATRVGDAESVQPHLTRALDIVERLGSPPLWTSHVRWSALQQGILLSSPERLAPHAKALVAASVHSQVAACMARAGRVWTAVLAGTVDQEAVVGAAESLARIGLLWDAARLAGHGAARTTDRRVAAQLLACARELHPSEGAPRPTGAESDDDASAAVETAPEEVLSDREIEVAQLVLRGRTYAEIGDTIFISPRTVEHHIAHIRRRLGASSRSEMLARLRLLLGDHGAGSGPADGPP
ncbi:LuxR C-terminal-related transcriptional regulator [Microbacterium sp.]|uniref:helix-turn-helix transcriptional regulator n=1 Tax=Microbacterium sp. TaxID=51671 RepID=UPI002811D855|nr:LuxR C-terminal-related transcriptional regulator [Microbacterium sp.]